MKPMKPIYRKLIWLLVILAIWLVMPAVFTQPIGAIYHLDPKDWLIKPIYAFGIMGVVQWLMFYAIL